MLLGVSRGRTTQKRALSVRYGTASRVISSPTITWDMSGASVMACTVPRSTALWRTLVCPAVNPCAL